jgi:hypothetical protein
MTLSAIEVHHLKQAPAIEGVLPVILHRWSPRSFADRDVSTADLKKLFEAARWAPSSYNEQPWRFLVGHVAPTPTRRYSTPSSVLTRGWAGKAPVLILGAAKTKFSHNETPMAMHSMTWAPPPHTLSCKPRRSAFPLTRWPATIRPPRAPPSESLRISLSAPSSPSATRANPPLLGQRAVDRPGDHATRAQAVERFRLIRLGRTGGPRLTVEPASTRASCASGSCSRATVEAGGNSRDRQAAIPANTRPQAQSPAHRGAAKTPGLAGQPEPGRGHGDSGFAGLGSHRPAACAHLEYLADPLRRHHRSRLSADSDGNPTPTQLARVTEAVHEYERGVAPRLILTGGAVLNRFVEARVMARPPRPRAFRSLPSSWSRRPGTPFRTPVTRCAS